MALSPALSPILKLRCCLLSLSPRHCWLLSALGSHWLGGSSPHTVTPYAALPLTRRHPTYSQVAVTLGIMKAQVC